MNLEVNGIPVYDGYGRVVRVILDDGQLFEPGEGKLTGCPIINLNGGWRAKNFSTFTSSGVRLGLDGSSRIANYHNVDGGDVIRCHLEQDGGVWWDVVQAVPAVEDEW